MPAEIKGADVKGERIAKRMARAGLCSRREAEAWILSGRVQVNGALLKTPACVVTHEDKIIVDGKPLKSAEPTKLYLYHKPAGLVVTRRDPEGRPTIFEYLPQKYHNLITIGRLDINTEGLLLLTNDGELARHLELPSTGWVRRYRVRVHGHPDDRELEDLQEGITVDGIQYGPIDAMREKIQGSNAWLILSLREGKNREVKNVLGALGLKVNRLIRVAFGPFQLGQLDENEVQAVPNDVLKDQLGSFLKRDYKK